MKHIAALILFLTITALALSAAAEENPMNEQNDMIARAIAQETGSWEMSDSIPMAYIVQSAQPGRVEEIEYPTCDYFGDGSEMTRRAFVYLPYGYSEEKQYKVLVLCHGIGGSEYEWGLHEKSSRVKLIMDNLIERGEIEPFIVVTQNGRAGNTSDYNAFYLFGKVLRNDLLPYMDAHYATYGHGVEDLSASRGTRAMAGLSMGAMQTINIGMCECLDLFSTFGAFSACPTTYPAAQIAEKLKAFPDLPIDYMYNICGTGDDIAFAHASAAAKDLPAHTDRLTEDNWCWQELPGAHDFGIWYLGFYNFARIFGAK